MEYFLPLFILAAQAADIVTTNLALSVSGTREANSSIAKVMEKLGKSWWIPKAVIGLGAAYIGHLYAYSPFAMLGLGGVSFYTLMVALNNYKIYKRNK